MTHISVSDAKAQLTDLVRRAESGEPITLTRHGKAVARIDAVRSTTTEAQRAAAIARAHAALHDVLFDETCAARSQDFLYDENGLPV